MLDNWCFPVRKLNQNINGTLRQLLKGREKHFKGFGESERNDLLSSKVFYCDERGWRGRTLCEYDPNKQQVTISEAFCQMVWLMCYTALVKEDYRITEVEFNKMSYLLKIKTLAKLNAFFMWIPNLLTDKDRYIYHLRNAYEVGKHDAAWRVLHELYSKKPVDQNIADSLDNLFEKDDLCYMVNSLYLYSVCFYLLHEYGHYTMKGDAIDMLLEEYKADAVARKILVSKSGNNYLKSSLYGMTAGICCLMFFCLKSSTHPDTDSRLKEVINNLPGDNQFIYKNSGLIFTFIELVSNLRGWSGFPSRNENNLKAVNDAFDYLENVKNGIVPSNN